MMTSRNFGFIIVVEKIQHLFLVMKFSKNKM